MRKVSPPRVAVSSSLTILMTCWAGLRALLSSSPTHRSRMRPTRLLTTVEVDVGLEQGQADLAQDLVDVGLAQAAAAADPGEDAFETVGECVEHGGSRLPEFQPSRFVVAVASSSTPTTTRFSTADTPGTAAATRPSSSRADVQRDRRRRSTTRPPTTVTSGWGRCHVRGACSSSKVTRSVSSASVVRPSGRRQGPQAAAQLAARAGGEQQAQGQPDEQRHHGPEAEQPAEPRW